MLAGEWAKEMTGELTLDANHRYRVGARNIPGTTQILSAAGLISDFSTRNERRREEGLVIHQCCALLAQGRLDWTSVDDRILGFVLSYQEFLDHTQWAARAVEVKLYDPDLWYAGTFDVDFLADPVFLFDLKSGAKAHWHKLQTVAYWHLNGRKGRRGALYLQEDGSMPKLVEHTDQNDWRVFVACLTLYHWRNNGSH